MLESEKQKKAEEAWARIEALGGHGVWDSDLVIVSLIDTRVTEEDLSLFLDFPFVQMLFLDRTGVGDRGLDYLTHLPALEELSIVGTKISAAAIDAFRTSHPAVKVTTESKPPPQGAVNPFTR